MGIRSNLRPLALFLIPTIFFACYPDTHIYNKEFKDKGKVEYTFSGTNNVANIRVDINEFESWTVYSGDSLLVPIIEGDNIVKATARNWYGEDPTPAEGSFDSPTQEEAEEIIDKVFGENIGVYSSLEKKALICLGASDDFSVDYLVRKNDDTDAIINYVGYGKNLEEECSNQELLDMYVKWDIK